MIPCHTVTIGNLITSIFSNSALSTIVIISLTSLAFIKTFLLNGYEVTINSLNLSFKTISGKLL